MPVREIRLKWNAIQSKFMQSPVRYIDFEGAIRSGKTTPAVWKGIEYAINHPGAKMLFTRWTQDSLDAQLKPRFYELCPPELLKSWNAKEEYQELTTGSWIYFRALRSTESASRYRKLAGLTLAWIFVDQPEEIPEDYFNYLVGRLSQPGYPHQLILMPNPPDEDHWLCREFPVDENKPGHLYLRTSVYDNAVNLGDGYIDALKAQYPVGSAQYRRMIEGRRGLSTIGDPVYKGYFKRPDHVREIVALKELPIIRSWDFGHRHPAVSWSQFTPWGGYRVLHEVMGDAQFIEDFAPLVLTVSRTLFPDNDTYWDCCDPAGADKQGHGLRRTAVNVLNDLGVYPRFLAGSNDPARRDYAIQTLGRYLSRSTKGGSAFEIHPRCRILVDAFEAGYVWEEIQRTGSLLPNTRRPKKDGYYDHLMNSLEYVMLNFAGAGIPDWRSKRSGSSEPRPRGPRDHDPDDPPRARPGMSRAGY